VLLYLLQRRCNGAPNDDVTAQLGGAPLSRLPPQCLVIGDDDVLNVPVNTSLWLDRIYFRLKRTDHPSYPILLVAFGDVYMTRCTIQGDGAGNCAAIHVIDGGRGYVEGD
jgi:hypothetical protein